MDISGKVNSWMEGFDNGNRFGLDPARVPFTEKDPLVDRIIYSHGSITGFLVDRVDEFFNEDIKDFRNGYLVASLRYADGLPLSDVGDKFSGENYVRGIKAFETKLKIRNSIFGKK
ncbi:hypothetical protein J4474_00040 [Candidatus Pacearchaeota archaeon]|nr:hypothetical protein [Candidatus Pacearchaeota archaeon]